MSKGWQQHKDKEISGSDKNLIKGRQNGPYRSMLQEAVDAVLGSFAKHTKGSGKVDVIDTLQEFWRMKNTQYDTPSRELIFEQQTSNNALYVCYVMLPGGSCFGSFQYCLTESEAKKSAAKIALMNSVFNEHPSRLITDSFIEQAVMEARAGNVGINDEKGIETFKYMLMQNKGKSMLEFQELMTMFRLLHWNGTFENLHQRSLTRDEVVLYYMNRELDTEIRNEMAESWLLKESVSPGQLNTEIAKATSELEEFRLAGRELRFFKEKIDILKLADERTRMIQT